jgi:hypothetical protein
MLVGGYLTLSGLQEENNGDNIVRLAAPPSSSHYPRWSAVAPALPLISLFGRLHLRRRRAPTPNPKTPTPNPKF